MPKNRGTPHFSPKNKCVLNDSKWPKTHFGNIFFFFWCDELRILTPPPQGVTFVTLFFFKPSLTWLGSELNKNSNEVDFILFLNTLFGVWILCGPRFLWSEYNISMLFSVSRCKCNFSSASPEQWCMQRKRESHNLIPSLWK